MSKLHVKDNTWPSQNVLNCLNDEDTFVADLLADGEAEFSAMEEGARVGGINSPPRHPNDHTTSLVLSVNNRGTRDCFFVGNSV